MQAFREPKKKIVLGRECLERESPEKNHLQNPRLWEGSPGKIKCFWTV